MKKIRQFTRLRTKKKKVFEVARDALWVRGPGISANTSGGTLKDMMIHIAFESLDAEDIRELRKLAPAMRLWLKKQAATK